MLRALESNWENMVMKARPLLDPRDIGRPNLRIIPIINFLAAIWVISAWVGKSPTELMTVFTKTSRTLFPYSPGLTSQKPNSPNSQTTLPWLCWFSWAPKSEYDLISSGLSSLRQNGGPGIADSSWTAWVWVPREQPLGWFDLHGCYLEFGVFVFLVSWLLEYSCYRPCRDPYLWRWKEHLSGQVTHLGWCPASPGSHGRLLRIVIW